MHARRPLAVLLAAVAVSLPVGASGPAAAGCIAPQLRLAGDPWWNGTTPEPRPSVAPGARVTVEGRAFRNGCDDYGGTTTFGCDDREQVTPMRDVTLRLVQRGRTWDLGTTDADAEYGAEWRVTLPVDARPGPARLLVPDSSEPLPITLTD